MRKDGKKRTKSQYDGEFKRVVLEEAEETTIAAASWFPRGRRTEGAGGPQAEGLLVL